MSMAPLFGQDKPEDPERSPAGRTRYLGRVVAKTMHWTGAPWLMRATREDEENGKRLRQWLAVKPGQSICDLGCGNGYHTVPLAKAVGAKGEVFAVDLQPQMLTLLRRRTERAELNNVRFVTATIDDPKLPKASCDLVLMVDVYHELSHPVRVMQHVRRALAKDGRVVLVEFRAEDPDVPIKPEHMMSKAQVIREMASHGFVLASECDELPWQHAMAFAPAAPKRTETFAAEQVLRGLARAAAGGDPRIAAPFLDAKLLARLTESTLPKLDAKASFELRKLEDGSVRAKHGDVTAQLRCDASGRWSVTDLSPLSPHKAPR